MNKITRCDERYSKSRAIRKWYSARESARFRACLFHSYLSSFLLGITGWNITTICTRGPIYNAMIPYCTSNNAGCTVLPWHAGGKYMMLLCGICDINNIFRAANARERECLRYTVIRTPCLFISWLRKTVYSLSCCLSSPQLSSSDVPRSSRVDSHNFSLILPWILLLCVRASSLYHCSSPVLGISCTKTARVSYTCPAPQFYFRHGSLGHNFRHVNVNESSRKIIWI